MGELRGMKGVWVRGMVRGTWRERLRGGVEEHKENSVETVFDKKVVRRRSL